MKFPVLCAIVLAGAVSISSPAVQADDAAPATQPAHVTRDAQQLIDQISSAYSGLHSLNLSGTIAVNLQVEGSSPETHSADFTSAYVAPNRFRHQVKDDVLIGNTGQKLYTFQLGENAYTQADAPKERVATKDLPKSLAGLLSIQDPSLVLAISKSPADELLSDVTDVTKADDTKIDDLSCPTLKFAQKDKSVVTVALDPQTHLLRQARFDLTPQLKTRRPDLTKALVTVTYTETTADEPSKDELFAWSPPPGAKDAAAMAVAQRMDAPEASQLEGKAAPQFKLDGLDGKPVSLADLKGKVVVLDFWATWCGPCRASLPHLNKLYNSEKDKGLQVFAVNEQEDKSDAQKFVDETKLDVPVLLDSEGKVGNQYGVTGIPQTVVIGKDGKVKKIMVGFGGEESAQELKKAVDSAMKE
ncbi:MAG TPA: redoxin family protein [Tepidisphaeraceae bacterium]|nr:redoxin family protein [Tepidisphaeraceae bacterium]